MTNANAAGTVALADGLVLGRMGYGAMQLPGKGVFGPPRDRDAAIAVLRKAVELGVRHIDTADFYGPSVSNELIREALHPYPEDLRIVTKVGAVRGDNAEWIMDRGRENLTASVHRNLKQLGVEALDVVNLRLGSHAGPSEESLAEPFSVLTELQQQGLIRHLGISEITEAQLDEAQSIATIVTVQNNYNLANRGDDHLVERCADEQIAFAPYFPLGGFSPLQHDTLNEVAARIGASPQQTALAWLLQRSPTITVIPGTSSVQHLSENVAAVDITLSAEDVADLDGIAAAVA
jgi:pyridoxine 4-dehydrogenase